jgi:NADPH:quinone reductase-like Zn-dependent oxidoreductase
LKAIVVRAFGPPSVLRLEEIATPEPGPDEVLIRVHAVTVNRTLDVLARAGKFARPVTLPFVPGVDPAGVVVAAGSAVRGRKAGDRVVSKIRRSEGGAGKKFAAVHRWGGYAEYALAPANSTHLVPDGVDFSTAAIVARHAPTAFHLLRDRAALKPHEWVLVMGAAGGLGSAGVQVAKLLGGRVIAAAGADQRLAAAVALGADVGINYRAADLTGEIFRITAEHGVDVVFENVGDPDLFPKAFAALAYGGRLVTAGGHAGGIVPLDVNRLYLNKITVIGATGESPADIDHSLQAAASGALKAIADRILPLAQAARAHEIVEARTGVGKIVLDPTLA